MFIHAHKARAFRNPNDGTLYQVPANFVGPVPDWVTKTAYFEKCCNSGSITAIMSTTDKAVAAAANAPQAKQVKENAAAKRAREQQETAAMKAYTDAQNAAAGDENPPAEE
jgi:hypothetical protein